MALVRQRSLILAKIESTYKTDPTPTGSDDAIEVEGFEQSWPGESIQRNPVRSSLGQLAPTHVRKYGELTFSVDLKGSGTPGTPPDAGVLLRSCGFGEIIVPGTSVTYLPISTGHESCTVYANRDGLLHKYTGCRGSFNINLPAGGTPKINFTMRGHVQDPTDTALPGTVTYDATVPAVVQGVAFSLGGYGPVCSQVNLDINNQIAVNPDMNDSNGYGEFKITGRQANGSFDPEAQLIATHDFWSDWEDSTQQALSVTLNKGAGNITTITAPAVVNTAISESDRNGVLVYDIPFVIAESSGDDELSIAFT